MAAVGLVDMDCGGRERGIRVIRSHQSKGVDTHRKKIHLPADNVEVALVGQRTAALDAERPQRTSTERSDGGSTPDGDGSCRRGEHHGA